MKNGILKSSSNTSNAKTIPAIGLLKIAAIPLAAPQARSKVVSLYDSLRSRPVLDPIALPVATIGASRPTEPPIATVTAEVSMCPKVC